jgi:formyltetrahydrofolate deformylase
MPHKRTAILLMHCPDQKGIIVAVGDFILKNGGNVIHLDEHVDAATHTFFMRVEWDLDDFGISNEKIGEFFQTLVANRFTMTWRLHFSDDVPRMAIFVSKLSHCLYDLLSRCQSGEWKVDVPLIVSNHPDLESVAQRFDIPYHVLPITPDNKKLQERQAFDLLQQHRVDFVVLARYMQVLTEDFVARFPDRIINIHHSFLPAFPGARPYHSAHERGVKVIGATSHYVTTNLDEGPIIEQDVVRVSHEDDVTDLVRKGQDLEKIVLSRAVWYHIRRMVLVCANRTVVFS